MNHKVSIKTKKESRICCVKEIMKTFTNLEISRAW